MGGWVYAGVLDDSHQRYDSLAKSQGSSFFSNQLLRQVFFGERILLNDGYLFSDGGLDHVLNTNSLLRSLVSVGFVKVITRTSELDVESFCSIPEAQAKAGQETAKRLVARADFADIKNHIRTFAQLANQAGIERFPNKRMNEGFHKLMLRLSSKSVADVGVFGMSTDMWQEFLADTKQVERYYSFPRDTVEKRLLALYSEKKFSKPTVDSVMAIANQAYHYNFSLCLSHEKKEVVAADTTIGLAFEDLLSFDQSYQFDPNDWQDAPRIVIPENFPLERFELIRDIVTPGMDIYQHKVDFLRIVKMIVSNDEDSKSKRSSLEHVFQTYRKQLTEHLAKKGYQSRSAVAATAGSLSAVALAIDATSDSLGIVHTLAPTAAALVALLSVKSNVQSMPFLGKLMAHAKSISRETNRKLVERSMRDKESNSSSLNSIAVYSGVAFNEIASSSHAESIPKHY